MRSATAILVWIWLGAVAATKAESSHEADPHWGQWRGPKGTGVAPLAHPPLEWAENKNVRWKIELPGEGQSTPIIWGDLVYIQAAVSEKSSSTANQDPKSDAEKKDSALESRRPEAPPSDEGRDPAKGPPTGNAEGVSGGERGPRGERDGSGRPSGRGRRTETPTDVYQFSIMSFDRKSGKQVWSHIVRKEVPHEGSHQDGSLAPASPLTDGSRLFAYFGSRGLYAFDMRGKLLWEKDFGDMKTRAGFGEGSTPALYQDALVVNWDHEGESFIVALDKNSGHERWRKSRDEVTTWATPLILDAAGKAQVIVPATKRIRSYDLANGNVLWECGGLGANCIPSPVAGLGMVYTMSGYREGALLAIRYEGATGDISGSEAVAWRTDKGTPYVPSPLLYGDALYFLQKNTGILSCFDAKTGTPYFDAQRLEEIDGVYASPMGADDRVYIVGRNGTTYVLKRGAQFEVLAVNKLQDEFSASPAAVDKELYLRGKKHLYCIAAD